MTSSETFVKGNNFPSFSGQDLVVLVLSRTRNSVQLTIEFFVMFLFPSCLSNGHFFLHSIKVKQPEQGRESGCFLEKREV